jgi:hypothetical protein
VGSKTFVWRDGVWVDTAFDPDVYQATPVNFASDVYFELVTAAPELAQYFAIGQRLLVVHEGSAYEIVESGGTETAAVVATIAVDANGQPLSTNEPTATPTAVAIGQNPTPGNLIAPDTRLPESVVDGPTSSARWGLFVALFLALVALGVGVQIGRRGRE